MKRFKVVFAVVLVLMLVFSMVGCSTDNEKTDKADATTDGGTTDGGTAETATDSDDSKASDSEPAADEGKVLRIYAWNETPVKLLEDYFVAKGLLPDGVKIEWVITPNQDNTYQNKLDEDLLADLKGDQAIDLFFAEADYILKYVNSPYALDVKGDLGLTDDELANQYQYTKDVATDDKGILRGVSWQATPGLFAYRRSIAKDVLGSDDPEVVQAAISNWEKFDETAALMFSKGYKMLSGYPDGYRVRSNNAAAPWVDENNNIIVDPNLMAWVDQTKKYTDLGYNNKTTLWSAEWSRDQGPEGKVFGFFYSTWGINFTLKGNSLADPDKPAEVGNGIYGDYGVAQGPEAYYWGGTWLLAGSNTDNKNLVAEIMRTITCDKETMKKITQDTQDYTNNIEAMNEIAKSDYGFDFLGGQNHIALFASAAPNIDASNMSPYDQGLNESFEISFHDYFNGTATKEEALDNFYKSALEKYPNLKDPR